MDEHPYIGRSFLRNIAAERRILNNVNRDRDYRGDSVITTYYLTAKPKEEVFSALENAVDMMLIHGTTETWPGPGREPVGYRKHMSFLKEIRFLKRGRKIESAIIKIGTPLEYFDKGKMPLAQLRMATQSEPFNAFIGFTARVVDYEFPKEFKRKFIGQVWPHKRVRKYLGIGDDEPIIGTIVKHDDEHRNLMLGRNPQGSQVKHEIAIRLQIDHQTAGTPVRQCHPKRDTDLSCGPQRITGVPIRFVKIPKLMRPSPQRACC